MAVKHQPLQQSVLPDAYFGKVELRPVMLPIDPRDDDAPLAQTPRDVVELLGFDPNELGVE